MDIVSHGLWGAIFFGRKNKRFFLISFFFGLLPDLLSFGIYFLMVFLGVHEEIDWSQGVPEMSAIPLYIHYLYNITHSLVVFSIVFGAIYLIRKKPFWPFAAYGLAVLLDIPTHSKEFFPTPFLWPLSDFTIDGFSWGQLWFMILNYSLIILAVFGIFIWRRRRG